MFQARLLTKPLARKGLPDVLNDQVSRADPSHVRDAFKMSTQARALSTTKDVVQDADSAIKSGRLACMTLTATSTVPTPEKWLDTAIVLESRLPRKPVFSRYNCSLSLEDQDKMKNKYLFVQDTGHSFWPKHLTQTCQKYLGPSECRLQRRCRH